MSYRESIRECRDNYFDALNADINPSRHLEKWKKQALTKLEDPHLYPNHEFVAYLHLGLATEQELYLRGSENIDFKQWIWQLKGAVKLRSEGSDLEVAQAYATLARAHKLFDDENPSNSKRKSSFLAAREAAIRYGNLKHHKSEGKNYLLAKDVTERIGDSTSDHTWLATAANMIDANARVHTLFNPRETPHLLRRAGQLFEKAAIKTPILESAEDFERAINYLHNAMEVYNEAAQLKIKYGDSESATPSFNDHSRVGHAICQLTQDTEFTKNLISRIESNRLLSITPEVRNQMYARTINLENLLREIQHPQ